MLFNDILAKCQRMQDSGASLDAIYDEVRQAKLDGHAIYAILKQLFNTDWAEVEKRLKQDKIPVMRDRVRPAWAPTQNRDAFRTIFDTVLEINARFRHFSSGKPAPRCFAIKLFGSYEHAGEVVDPDVAFEAVYLGDHLYFGLISVELWGLKDNCLYLILRITGHHPRPFRDTSIFSGGIGPFSISNILYPEQKQIIQEELGKIKAEIDILNRF